MSSVLYSLCFLPEVENFSRFIFFGRLQTLPSEAIQVAFPLSFVYLQTQVHILFWNLRTYLACQVSICNIVISSLPDKMLNFANLSLFQLQVYKKTYLFCCIVTTIYTYTYACINIFKTIKTSRHSSLEKYTSHFICKGSKGLRSVL